MTTFGSERRATIGNDMTKDGIGCSTGYHYGRDVQKRHVLAIDAGCYQMTGEWDHPAVGCFINMRDDGDVDVDCLHQ